MRQVLSGVAAGMSLAVKNGWEAAIRRGPVLWLTLCGVLLVAGIFAVTAMAVGEFRERTLANRERELENTVQLIARHFDQQFEDSDVVAADVIGQMNLPEITSPAMFRERMSGPAANQMLRSKISAVSYLGDIVIYDAEGEIVNWSRAQPLPHDQHRCPRLFPDFQVGPAIRAGAAGIRAQLRHRQMDHGRRATSEHAGRHFPRRPGAPDRSRQLSSLFCFRGARRRRGHFAVRPRRQDAGALPACRRPDRQELQGCAIDAQNADRRRPAHPARQRSDQRRGPPRLGGVTVAFPAGYRRDQYHERRVGRLAAADRLHGHPRPGFRPR
ncbi:hypothetical protein ACVWWP_008446 [Bradyrhizobium sp. LM3.6]